MNKLDFTARESSSVFVISFLLCQLLVVIFNVFGLIFGGAFGYNLDDLNLFLYTALGYLICTIALNLGMAICFIFCKKKYNLKTISKPKLSKSLLYLGIGIISFFMLYPIVSCVDTLLSNWGLPMNDIPYTLTTPNYLISIVSLCVLPAVFEELLFRALIHQGFSRNGKWVSIIMSSVMFSIFHMSIYQTVYPLLFGLLLGGIMYKENNILYTILAHFTNNFLSVLFTYLDISFVFNHWSYILLAIILCIVWLTAVIIFIAKTNTRERVKFNKIDYTFIVISIVIMLIIWILNFSAS